MASSYRTEVITHQNCYISCVWKTPFCKSCHKLKLVPMWQQLYKSLRSPTLLKPCKILKGPGQHPLQVKFQEMLHHGQNSSLQSIFVMKDLKSNLLGLPALTALNLVVRLDSAYTFLVQDSFLSVFEGLGNLGEPCTIKLQNKCNTLCTVYAQNNSSTTTR